MAKKLPDPRWFARPGYKLMGDHIVIFSKLPAFEKDGGVELYKYRYFPFLNEDLKNKLTAEFDNSEVLSELFQSIEQIYQREQFDCMYAYFERSIGTHDRKELIESELALNQSKSLEGSILYRAIHELMVYQKILRVEEISELIYDNLNSSEFIINLKLSAKFTPIRNSISQVVQKRYRSFLEDELNSIRIDSQQSNHSFRIAGNMPMDEIERYFMQLTNIHADYPSANKEQLCVLTKDQVVQLLYKNDLVKYTTPNFSQQQLRIFIYNFKKLHSSVANKVADFVQFEIDKFSAFEGLTYKTEYSNFFKGENARLYPPYDSF
ncbi:MAG: hypothetical protein ACJ77K_17625 [Bacteroidia bacterium]